MKKPKLSMREDIRIRLLQSGYSSYEHWATQHGYKRSTVTQVIRRHIVQRLPATGEKTRKILADLSTTIGINLN